jgi:hypothetical protein
LVIALACPFCVKLSWPNIDPAAEKSILHRDMVANIHYVEARPGVTCVNSEQAHDRLYSDFVIVQLD